MIDTPTIVPAPPARPAAVIRLVIPREDMPKVMGPAIGELMSVIAAEHAGPAGPIYSHHFRISPGIFDFEVGVPLTKPISAAGRVLPAHLPGHGFAQIAQTIYRGPYEGLGNAWGEFDAWLKSNNHAAGSTLWEFYLKGPESGRPPSEWETLLNRPLASRPTITTRTTNAKQDLIQAES